MVFLEFIDQGIQKELKNNSRSCIPYILFTRFMFQDTDLLLVHT